MHAGGLATVSLSYHFSSRPSERNVMRINVFDAGAELALYQYDAHPLHPATAIALSHQDSGSLRSRA